MTVSYGVDHLLAMMQNSFQSINFFDDVLPSDVSQPDPSNQIFQNPAALSVQYDGNGFSLIGTNPCTVTQAGTIQCFRAYATSSGGGCTVQGTVSLANGGGDMILDAVDVTVGQVITVTEFTISATLTAV